ncbi:UNVERIFIED_CONTAM: hypothetical protein HDU68_000246 [Siphonaria sp. JEL0065]|nr:hypothetical protein HDU68_000246 [Siphonaria sp. JEL0065]
MLTSTSVTQSNPSLRRILIELKELQTSPLIGITVTPHDTDVRLLCVTMIPQEGIYKGIPLHLGVNLINGYPTQSPVVTIDTLITHPNVFSRTFICCDLLKGRLFTDSKGRVSGYSPAYSLGTILLQLMSFFSATNIEQDWEGVYTNSADESARVNAIENVERFSCVKCGYKGNEMAAKANVMDMDESVDQADVGLEQRVLGSAGGALGGLASVLTIETIPNEVLLEIADHMAVEDIIKLSRAVPRFGELVAAHSLKIRRDQKCFFYKTGCKDATLGVGIWMAEKGRNRDMKPADFDLLSYSAFQSGVRQTIWGSGFTHFLPLALTPQHLSRGLPILQDTLFQLDNGRSHKFTPDVGLRVLSKLINLMVVDLMKEMDASISSDGDSRFSATAAPRKTKLIASEKALTGYSQLLHLLLSLCHVYPEITKTAETQLGNFLTDKDSRGKNNVPNLGEFLVLLFCQSKYTWSELALPVFRECSTRNVVWMLEPKHGNKPFLAFFEPDASSDFRLSQTFSAQQTSLRLLMFQVLFMKRIGLGKQTPMELLAQLNRRFGYPEPTLAETLVEDIKGIYAVKSFNAFLPLVGIPLPTKEYFSRFLKDAIVASEQKRYHKCRYSESQLYSMRLKAEPEFDKERKIGVEEFRGSLNGVPYSIVVATSSNPKEPSTSKEDLHESINLMAKTILSVEKHLRAAPGTNIVQHLKPALTASLVTVYNLIAQFNGEDKSNVLNPELTSKEIHIAPLAPLTFAKVKAW